LQRGGGGTRRLHHPLDADDTAEFTAALEPIMALAEATPGFVWRLVDDAGQSSRYVRLPDEDDPLMIVNMSLWADLADAHRRLVHLHEHGPTPTGWPASWRVASDA